MHSTKIFLILAGHFWLYLVLVIGIFLFSKPFGALWIRNLVPSTGVVIAVVWLGWVVGIFGVRISLSLALICPVFVPCNTTSLLFYSIDSVSSLGLSHILLGVLI